jgi:hypothetical protein
MLLFHTVIATMRIGALSGPGISNPENDFLRPGKALKVLSESKKVNKKRMRFGDRRIHPFPLAT